LVKLIQEYVLGEFDADTTDAYHENHTLSLQTIF
jgi:hypothetical protein